MKHELYPELEQLFSCYLHEDWHYDYPTRDAALQAGIAGLPPDALRAACEEMDRLRADSRDTVTRTELVRGELGAFYLWEVDGYTLDAWLAHVDVMLNQRRKSMEKEKGLLRIAKADRMPACEAHRPTVACVGPRTSACLACRVGRA
jgi:hypothetical protein